MDCTTISLLVFISALFDTVSYVFQTTYSVISMCKLSRSSIINFSMGFPLLGFFPRIGPKFYVFIFLSVWQWLGLLYLFFKFKPEFVNEWISLIISITKWKNKSSNKPKCLTKVLREHLLDFFKFLRGIRARFLKGLGTHWTCWDSKWVDTVILQRLPKDWKNKGEEGNNECFQSDC